MVFETDFFAEDAFLDELPHEIEDVQVGKLHKRNKNKTEMEKK